MTKTEQDKILEDKIKSNTAHFTLNRQTAIVSAFASGDFDKYEYLTRIDLALKQNSLQKARFEHSPLGNLLNKKLNKELDDDGRDNEYNRILDEVARIPFDRRQSDEDTYLPRESFNDGNAQELFNLRDKINNRIDHINEVLEENQPNR